MAQLSSFSEFLNVIPQVAQDWRSMTLYLFCIVLFTYVIIQRNKTIQELKAIEHLSGPGKNQQISIVLRRYPFLNKDGMSPTDFLSFTKARYTFILQVATAASILVIISFFIFAFLTGIRVQSEIGPAVSGDFGCGSPLISCAQAQTEAKQTYFNSDPCSLDFKIDTKAESDLLKISNIFPYREAVTNGQIVTTYECLFPVKLYSQDEMKDSGKLPSPYKISVRHLNAGLWPIAPAKIRWKISEFTPDHEVIFISHMTAWVTKDVPITLENIGAGKLKNFKPRLLLLKKQACSGLLRQVKLGATSPSSIENAILEIDDKPYDGRPIVDFEDSAIRLRPAANFTPKSTSYCMYLTASYELASGEARVFRLLSAIEAPDGLGAPAPPDTTYNILLDPKQREGSLDISRIVKSGELDHYQIRFDTRDVGTYKLELSVEDLNRRTIANKKLLIELWKPSYALDR